MINAVDGPARHALVFQMVGPEDLHNAVALTSSLGTIGARARPGDRRRRRRVRRRRRRASRVNAASFLAILVSLLALDTSKLLQARARSRRDAARRRRATRSATSRGSQRAGVAFVVVFMLATFSFNFNVLLPLVADRTLHRGAQTFGLIAAVFGAGALCGALDQRDARRREPAAAADRRDRLRRLRAAARAAALALPRLRAALRDRDLLHAVGHERALGAAARGAASTCAGARRACTSSPSRAARRSAACSPGWLTAVGGTRLAFLVGGVCSLGMAALGIMRLGGGRGVSGRASRATFQA